MSAENRPNRKLGEALLEGYNRMVKIVRAGDGFAGELIIAFDGKGKARVFCKPKDSQGIVPLSNGSVKVYGSK
jgi:hypothetical protein